MPYKNLLNKARQNLVYYLDNRHDILLYRKLWAQARKGNYPTFWLCDICNKPISGRKIQFDHDHKTGAFRGWLCPYCNTGLGWLENLKEFDSP